MQVLACPPVTRAAWRQRTIAVPGRAELLTPLGGREWAAVLRRVELALNPQTDFQAVMRWLNGRGTLILGNESNRALEAEVTDAAVWTAMPGGGWHGVVSFLCQPLKRQEPAEPDITAAIETNATGGTITGYNPGDVTAKPLFTITGSGTISLTGETGLIAIEIPELATGCRVDTASEHVTTLDMSENLGEHVTFQGDAIRSLWIPRGPFSIEWSGAITALTLTPRWRWL